MRYLLIFIFLIDFAIIKGQELKKDSSKINSNNFIPLFIYDGLVIKSFDYAKTLNPMTMKQIDVIKKNPKDFYNVSDSVGLILVTTVDSANKDLKIFTKRTQKWIQKFPYVEFSINNKLIDSDSLRLAFLSRLKDKTYKVKFLKPKRAIKNIGDSGRNGLIKIIIKPSS